MMYIVFSVSYVIKFLISDPKDSCPLLEAIISSQAGWQLASRVKFQTFTVLDKHMSFTDRFGFKSCFYSLSLWFGVGKLFEALLPHKRIKKSNHVPNGTWKKYLASYKYSLSGDLVQFSDHFPQAFQNNVKWYCLFTHVPPV